MALGRIIPRCFSRYYTNRKLSKKFVGVSIANNVDLQNVRLADYVNFAHHSQASNSSIGERTSIGRYSKIAYAIIGKFCSISWDVTIGAISHPMHAISTHAFSFQKRFGLCKIERKLEHQYVEIGNDVWVGTGVIIMPGLHVGNGAVIGGGSVVTHSVEDYEIVAGCPARHIGWRFDEDIREQLSCIKWWDFTDEVIKKNIDLFSPFNDITKDKEIIKKLKEIKK